MAKATNTLSELRSVGKSKNCIYDASKDRSNPLRSDIVKIEKLDCVKSDELAEKILDKDDFDNAFFLAPLNCSKLLEDDDEEGDEYWGKHKPLIAEKITEKFSLRYGIDFAILRRGVFSLLVFLTKNNDGEWDIPSNIKHALMVCNPDMFMDVVDLYYRNTDSLFFPINAITKTSESEKPVVKKLQIDISFLRSDSFKSCESEEGRRHFTYNIFKEGMLHSVILEHDVISFDDEKIDEYLSENSEKECFSE